MAYPAGVELVSVTVGSSLNFFGTPLPIKVQVSPVLGGSATRLIWAATGQTVVAGAMEFSGEAGSIASFDIPNPDQPGFLNGAGNEARNWSYTATITVGAQRWVQAFQPVSGQTEIDLDLVQDGQVTAPTSAPVPAVTSVNGQTGAVTISGGGDSVDWDDLTEKPSEFPPSPHGHTVGEVEGLQDALDNIVITDEMVAEKINDPASLTGAALSATIAESTQSMVTSLDVRTFRVTHDPNEIPTLDGEVLLLLGAPTVTEAFPSEGTGLPAGWSQKYSSTSTVSTTVDGLVADKSDVLSELFAWDKATATLGSRADAEILVKVKIAGSSAAIIGPFAYLRGGGDAETRQGIGFGWRGGTSAQLRLYRYVDGVATSIGQADGAFPTDTWAWIRFQAIGTTARGRMWLDGATEPDVWDITETVPAPTPGFVGVLTQRNTVHTIGYVSVGYNGTTAPMEV